jgi:hypothetical protein
VVTSLSVRGDPVTGLTTTVEVNRSVTLDWTDAADATEYIIKRDGVEIDRVLQGVETFNDPFDGAELGVTGSVVDDADDPVEGLTVQLIDANAAVVDTDTTSALGAFSLTADEAGVHTVLVHAPLAFCCDDETVNVNGAQSAVDVTLTPSIYDDDFTAYDNINDMHYGDTASHAPSSGKFGYRSPAVIDFVKAKSQGDESSGPSDHYGVGPGDPPVPGTGIGQFSLVNDVTLGRQVYRQKWAASALNVPGGSRTPSEAADQSNYYVRQEGRVGVNVIPNGTSEIWLRFTDKFSSNWRCGGGGATGSQLEYKSFFLSMAASGTGGSSAFLFQLEIDDQNNTPSSDLIARIKIVDIPSGGGQTQRASHDTNLAADFLGDWHTWVVGMTGIGTANYRLVVYLDGVLLDELDTDTVLGGPIAFLNGQTIGGATGDMPFEMGANINNGPNQEQTRDWAEFGLYFKRPSLLPLVA